MNERFENAKLYLIDLLRAYGHRPVIETFYEPMDIGL